MVIASLIVYMVAFAIGAMTLGLDIVYELEHQQKWNKYLIACLGACLGCLMVLALQQVVYLAAEGILYRVLSLVIGSLVLGVVVFLAVFVPYFTCWVISKPWRDPYRLLFICLAIVDAIVGIVGMVEDNPICDQVLEVLFVFDLAYSFLVVRRNIDSIEDSGVRAVCITLITVSLAMLPAIASTLVFPSLKGLMCGIYFLAFSTTIMVYLFIHFHREQQKQAARRELVLEDLASYHITEREFGVIQLIAKGLTNKEIASELSISVNTVNNHVANIFTKTHVRSRIDLLNLLKQSW